MFSQNRFAGLVPRLLANARQGEKNQHKAIVIGNRPSIAVHSSCGVQE
jgi:hypothetical protein